MITKNKPTLKKPAKPSKKARAVKHIYDDPFRSMTGQVTHPTATAKEISDGIKNSKTTATSGYIAGSKDIRIVELEKRLASIKADSEKMKGEIKRLDEDCTTQTRINIRLDLQNQTLATESERLLRERNTALNTSRKNHTELDALKSRTPDYESLQLLNTKLITDNEELRLDKIVLTNRITELKAENELLNQSNLELQRANRSLAAELTKQGRKVLA